MLNTLAKLREERAEGEKGFTLIELLVVVVIIGILVAIAIPLYLNYRKGAENKDAQSDVRNAIGAIENCYADNNNRYPGTATTAVSSTGGYINLTCVTTATNGTATASTSSGGDQTINISDGVALTYTPGAGLSSYTVSASYTGSGHKTYTYTSSTGKTVTS